MNQEGHYPLGTHFKGIKNARQKLIQRSKDLRDQLRRVGLTPFDMLKPETFHLADTLFDDEIILAAVCGQSRKQGSALLLVTNLRIIYLNQIPLFTDMEEAGYGTINGAALDTGRWTATVTLFTAIGKFHIRTTNIKAARNFIEAINRVTVENRAALSVPNVSPRPEDPTRYNSTHY